MDDLSHNSRHAIYSRYYVPHRILEEDTDHAGAATCSYCECPHIKMPNVGGQSMQWVAVEAKPCPQTFEEPCVGCGKLYRCAPGCTFIKDIISMLEAQGYGRLDDDD